MKVKFGAFVVDGRGKSNGHVFTKNRAGAVIRTKVTPVNPRSPDQMSVRTSFAASAQSWRGLTQAQLLAWNGVTNNWKNTDIYGDSKVPSGFNLYKRLNDNLAAIGVAAISAAPMPTSVTAQTSLSLAIDIALSKFELTFSPAIPATQKLIIEATPGVSAGKFFVESEYRQITFLTSADVSPKNVYAAYVAKFGALPAAGEKAFVRIRPVVIANGQSGTSLSTSAISA